MSEKIVLYDASDESIKPGLRRKIAVEAALELIRANGLGSSDVDRLDSHIGHVGKFADAIQRALEFKV